MVRKLEPNFSEVFDGKIWKIITNQSGRFLLIEIRNEETFLTEYRVYDAVDNKFSGSNFSFEERWWIGASFFDLSIIIFHTFPESDSPEVKNFFAYDFSSQNILWNKDRLSILEFSRNTFLALDSANGGIVHYDLVEGKELDKTSKKDDKGDKNNYLLCPFHYDKDSEHFNTVEQFLKEFETGKLQGGVDYYEADKEIILSYYTGDKVLQNHIIVIDKKKNILLKDMMGNNLKGISDRSFFIYHDKLIFVKNGDNFLSYQLARR